MRVLDVGPFIAYPPRRGRAARAYGLLLALSAKHDVRHFGREPRPLVSRVPPLEEVPVTPMFRVFRCRYPLGGPWGAKALETLAWSAGIVIVFGYLAVRRYRRAV